jgi:hypothetical protein
MSLAHAAEHLKKHGRGPDTELVHMSKKEIKGLQELAMAHGGSLTINPHTGLPEAGFLDSLLPTIIGVGLSVASGGALTPLMAAGITGAGYGLATGDLNKGLMAGLGAYGGAGLGAGLTSAGTAAAQATADTATSAAANQAAQTAGQEVATNAATNAATQGIDTAGQDYVKRLAMEQAGDAVPRTLASAPTSTDIGGNLTRAGEGFKSLGSTEGRSAFMSGMSDKAPYATPALGFSAMNAATPEQKPPGAPEPDEYDKRLSKYKLSPNFQAYEAPRPNPYYSAQYQNFAEGGLAMGGVSNMPPQTNFANPSSYEEGTSQYSMATDPMSGNIANRMAEGGVTGSGQMQLNVPLSVGGGEGGSGGSPYTPAGSGGGGYAPPGGPQGGFGMMENLMRGQAAPLMQRGLGGKGMAGAQMEQMPAGLSDYGMVNRDQPMYDSTNSTSMADFNRGDPYAGTPMNERMGSLFNMGRGIGFARGGHLSASAGIPETGIYSDSDLTTRGEQALGASNAKLAQLYKRAGLKYAAAPKGGIEKLGGGFSEAGAGGGLSHLGGYSDGGRMLKGPGDGMSDDIPAMIGKKQPARLADGEFVVPADVVSHLGNGSTDAGAKKLYGMMDKIRKARTGRKAQGKQINPNKFIPA